MNLAAKVTSAFFESKGMKYRVHGDDEEILSLGFGLDNVEYIDITLFFGEDNSDVGVRAFDFCKIPENKKEKMYKVCSDLNGGFRWVRFYVDEKDSTLTASVDAVIQLDSCGEEVFELVLRMAHIIDDAYPVIMKALWS